MQSKSTTRTSLKELKERIPSHCFKPSNFRSSTYIVRDLALSLSLAYGTYCWTCYCTGSLRLAIWIVYGILQGMVMTGVWILAHECGHQALFSSKSVNDSIGFILHSLLLVPYFSWKYSHSLHHRYTNHMEKDTVFVPYRKSEKKHGATLLEKLHVAEDAPALNFFQLVLHQLFGWPAYLVFNISAGRKSLQSSTRDLSYRQSHIDPFADNFTAQQHPYVLASDLSLIGVCLALYFLSLEIGASRIVLLYFMPWLWVNNWIIAITYLHHTHPSAEHFEAGRWTFRDGALQTIDRDFGFIGEHIFHGIIEYHMIHHLFTHIPFYHAKEATEAIKEILGDEYHRVETSFLKDFWLTFTSCHSVEAHPEAKGVLVWSQR